MSGGRNEPPSVHGQRLGVVVGHSLPFAELIADGAVRRDVEVEPGAPPVTLFDTEHAVMLARHGVDSFTPAHLLPHHRHIAALTAAGCGRVLGFASVGSLRRDWPVGTIVAPDDFIAPHVNATWFDDARGHTVPGFDPSWRQSVIDVWRAATATPVVDGGVYWQTTGPRFETPAEVRMLAGFADVVGMTFVAECLLAREIGLPYAALCTIDNLANGLDDTPLTPEVFRAGVASNQARLREDLEAFLPALAAAG